ncbi:hypothetical protein CEXT_313211 [Caerostris extrusa]|uniref:Uncharacterized protein n=1 Tax=Caerostris extrusa TaxID=172846 RepID=A0AAV4QEY8_CAEEX|nr:hypothetical protein CEXT_313211 [Caerostris extrusa]
MLLTDMKSKNFLDRLSFAFRSHPRRRPRLTGRTQMGGRHRETDEDARPSERMNGMELEEFGRHQWLGLRTPPSRPWIPEGGSTEVSFSFCILLLVAKKWGGQWAPSFQVEGSPDI